VCMRKSKTWLVFISLVSLIVVRFFTGQATYQNGQKVRVSATVLTEPIRYETSQYLKVTGLKIYLPLFPEISYGDKIVVEGIVENRSLKDATLKKLQTERNYLFDFRKKLITFYQSVLSEPYAGLIAGITLGSKGALSGELWEKVKLTGVAHVVVASGMNVTFVTAFLINFLSVFLPRKKSIPFAILGIILYLLVAGFEAPLIRAAIMGTVAFLAQETGRLVTAAKALLLSAAIMLLINPLWVGDLGFILSFVATASLMLFERRIREKLKLIPDILKEGLSTSLAAQIGVTPILFVTFGQFNILSPVINALVLWTIPLIMILGSIGGIVGLVVPILGKSILYLSYPLLWYFVSIVTLFLP